MEIKGYTLHGDYYLADEVIPNKNWKQACEMKEVVILPNGKKVIAHTLSKEELETIQEYERATRHNWYWTNTTTTDGDGAWFVSYGGNLNYRCTINYSNANGGARLGFKNPF